MKWVNALSKRPSLEAAIAEVANTARDTLETAPDLGLVFISSAFASEYPRLMPLLQERLDIPTLIGCGGGGVVGSSPDTPAEEIERFPALSLTLASLPEATAKGFHIAPEDLPDLDSSPDRWVELIGVSPQDNPHFILLADPSLSKVNDLLEGLDFAYPNAEKIGGLASAGFSNRGMSLFCNGELYEGGTVGVALSGNIVLDSIVAQGCRPIGDPYRIARSDRNIVLELEDSTGGEAQPPLEALRELVQTLSEADRKLAQTSLFIGVVRDEFKQQLERGDFLIRNLLGVDPRVGAIAVGDRIRPGQRIQFHLRDAKASAEDLEMLLQRYNRTCETSPVGALMFACLGRGEGLYGKPNFDSELVRQYLGDLPISGFFCNGEIGPVGGATFLHGYTSVLGICRPA